MSSVNFSVRLRFKAQGTGPPPTRPPSPPKLRQNQCCAQPAQQGARPGMRTGPIVRPGPGSIPAAGDRRRPRRRVAFRVADTRCPGRARVSISEPPRDSLSESQEQTHHRPCCCRTGSHGPGPCLRLGGPAGARYAVTPRRLGRP